MPDTAPRYHRDDWPIAAAMKPALGHGFDSAVLCEHDGGDGVSVGATNRNHLRRILPRAPKVSGATP